MSSDEQAIRDLQKSWIEASSRGDLPAVLALMTDDIVFLTAGRPPFGRAEYIAQTEANQGKMTVSGDAEFEEVVVVGDVAYGRGKLHLTITPTSTGEPRTFAGYTLSVFRRDPAGVWRLARDANFVAPV